MNRTYQSSLINDIDPDLNYFGTFKLSVSPADYEKVFDEELWEEGTRVREWGAHGRPY